MLEIFKIKFIDNSELIAVESKGTLTINSSGLMAEKTTKYFSQFEGKQINSENLFVRYNQITIFIKDIITNQKFN